MNKLLRSGVVALFLTVVVLITGVLPVDAGDGGLAGGAPGTTFYANSPILRKFIDSLPGLGPTGANNLGQYIPIANPDTVTFPGYDYYEIAVQDYAEQMHTDLQKPTRLRGYVQLNNGTGPGGINNVAPAPQHYLGPLILAQKGTPVRIKFVNKVANGNAGNLFIPVDTTIMGAGLGPLRDTTAPNELYTENRAELHLHGGFTPWISDGTPHQWITPANEITSYPKGVSFQNVPDMVGTPILPSAVDSDGIATYYYTNAQSSRLMFYHDHALGLTRLNVYAGEAAGYLLMDTVEQGLISAGFIPSTQIPLIIQDKTFVPDDIGVQDAKWDPGKWGQPGDLWFPHVYETNQNPASADGSNPFGRWDYGPWFWPVFPAANPLPEISLVPEAFMDTAMVNGTAYPYLEVDRTAYRFRILNAANDRFFNLQLHCADTEHPTEVVMVPAVATAGYPAKWPTDQRDGGVPDPARRGPQMIQIGTEGGLLPAPVVHDNQPINYEYNRRSVTVLNVLDKNLFLGPAERADVIIDFSTANLSYCSRVILYNDAPAPVPAADPRIDYYTGNVDYTASGGAPTTEIGYGPNTRTIMQFRINTSSAPVPYPKTLPELTAAINTAYLASQPEPVVPQAGYPGKYQAASDTYATIFDNSLTFAPYDPTANGGLGGIAATTTTFPFKPNAIHELFDPEYGRMNSVLGYEQGFTNALTQTTVPLYYVDPPREIMLEGQPQLWKITHNGVDTHAIHFHLFDVQVINRIGWDGTVKPPDPNELGWKETVRMNPLEDIVVAMRPGKPPVPFPLPESTRLLSPTLPPGSPMGFTRVGGQQGTITNEVANFGFEYVWHCHLLGHEENDMMRPTVLMAPSTVPDAPLSLTATTPATPTLQIDLSWIHDQSRTIAFRIERSADGAPFESIDTYYPYKPVPPYYYTGANASGMTTVPTPWVSSPNQTYTDLTVLSGKAYKYRVVPFNINGDAATPPETSPDITITISDPVTPPTAPSGFAAAASALSSNPPRVRLTWIDNSTNESGFEIEKGGPGIFPNILVGPNIREYVDTAVLADTTYLYKIRAVNAAGNSDPGWAQAPVSVTTPGILPKAPSGLTADMTVPGQVGLSWTNNSVNETGFYIQRATGAGLFVQIATALAGSTGYSDTTVVLGTQYSYRVVAYNTYGSSPPSNVVTVATATTLPAAPSDLTAVASAAGVSPQSITLHWTDHANNEAGFQIMKSDGNGPFSLLATVGANVTGYVDTLVAPSTTYFYQVAATNAAGPSSSGIASATTPALVSAAPSNLVAIPSVLSTNPAVVTLTWADNSANEIGFTVERATNLLFTQGFTQFSVNANITQYTDITVSANPTTYYYRVSATGPTGSLGVSNTVQVASPGQLPAAPSNLLAAPSSLSTNPPGVILIWTDNSGNETGFTLERATNLQFTQGLAQFAVGANVTFYSDTTVSVNPATYYYRVFASSAAGNSGLSNSAQAVTPGQLPLAPASLTAVGTATPSVQVNLAWTDTSNNETGFQVQRASGTGAFAVITTLGPNVTSYSDTQVSPATTYFYIVAAVNDSGVSGLTNIASATTPQVVPAVPDNLTALPSALSTSQPGVALNWSDNSGNETGFTIERAADALFTQGLAQFTVGANVTSYSDTTISTEPAVYYYRVSALNIAGSSGVSNTAQVTTPGQLALAPTNLAAAAVGGLTVQVNLTWADASVNETGFEIRRAEGNGPFAVIATVGANLTNYSDLQVAPSTDYLYTVAAVNASGVSGLSNVAAATTPALIPAAPAGLVATPSVLSTNPPVVTLSWADNSSNETGFVVERATDALFTQGLVLFTTGPNVTSYPDITVSADPATYYYRVTASNATGSSGVSNTVQVATPGQLPAAPAALVATEVGSLTIQVNLGWSDASANETGFQIERAVGAGAFEPLATVGANVVAYSDTTVLPFTSYSYRVYASNTTGNSAVSNVATPPYTAVRIERLPLDYYTSFTDAFAAVLPGETIKAWGVGFAEPVLSFNMGAGTVTVVGGYDTIYNPNSAPGMTTLMGTLTVEGAGTLVLDKFIIQ